MGFAGDPSKKSAYKTLTSQKNPKEFLGTRKLMSHQGRLQGGEPLSLCIGRIGGRDRERLMKSQLDSIKIPQWNYDFVASP